MSDDGRERKRHLLAKPNEALVLLGVEGERVYFLAAESEIMVLERDKTTRLAALPSASRLRRGRVARGDVFARCAVDGSSDRLYRLRDRARQAETLANDVEELEIDDENVYVSRRDGIYVRPIH